MCLLLSRIHGLRGPVVSRGHVTRQPANPTQAIEATKSYEEDFAFEASCTLQSESKFDESLVYFGRGREEQER